MRAKAKKILVIGGAGYLGCVVVDELLRRGYAVRVFDRLIYGDDGLRDVRDRLEVMVGDMRAMDPSAFEDVAAVINLGGLSNDPTAEFNPDANYQMNTVATEMSAKQAKQAGVERYVFASSCSIYDQGVEDPDADLILDENSEVSPRAAYSSSKFEGEQRLGDGGFELWDHDARRCVPVGAVELFGGQAGERAQSACPIPSREPGHGTAPRPALSRSTPRIRGRRRTPRTRRRQRVIPSADGGAPRRARSATRRRASPSRASRTPTARPAWCARIAPGRRRC